MSSKVKNWSYFLFGLLCAGIFMFIIAPWVMNSTQTLRQYQENVQKNDLHAGVYFYTQVEQSGIGSQTIERSVKHAALNTPQKNMEKP